MKVFELIEELRGLPAGMEVRYFVDWDDERDVNEVEKDSDNQVILGDDLPPEKISRYYKYER